MSGPQRRERIVEAAIDVFAERGYDGASMRDIAAAAGISKPVLYDHFDSKRALFAGLMKAVSGELTSNTAVAMAGAGSPEERYRRSVDAFFAYVEERPNAARVLFVTPKGDPEVLADSRRHQDNVTADLAALLASERDLLSGVRDRQRRLVVITELLKAGINGLAEWWSDHPEIARNVIVQTTMDITWSGLRSLYVTGN